MDQSHSSLHLWSFISPLCRLPLWKFWKTKSWKSEKIKERNGGFFAKYFLPHSRPKFLDLSKKGTSRKKGQLSSIWFGNKFLKQNKTFKLVIRKTKKNKTWEKFEILLPHFFTFFFTRTAVHLCAFKECALHVKARKSA